MCVETARAERAGKGVCLLQRWPSVHVLIFVVPASCPLFLSYSQVGQMVIVLSSFLPFKHFASSTLMSCFAPCVSCWMFMCFFCPCLSISSHRLIGPVLCFCLSWFFVFHCEAHLPRLMFWFLCFQFCCSCFCLLFFVCSFGEFVGGSLLLYKMSLSVCRDACSQLLQPSDALVVGMGSLVGAKVDALTSQSQLRNGVVSSHLALRPHTTRVPVRSWAVPGAC